MPRDDHPETYDRRRNASGEADGIAATVISALSDRQVLSRDGVRQSVLDHLVHAILAQDEFDAENVFAQLRGHRLTVDAIVDVYIPSAARSLGQSWVEDTISFADVTIGTLRLQSLLGQAVSQPSLEMTGTNPRLRALLVLPQGEQHFLGINVVAAQMRRIGCDVSMSFDEGLETLNWRVKETQPSLVLISCSRRESLETIKQMVQSIRLTAPDGPLIVLGGAVLIDTDDLQARTGVDMVTVSAKDAAAFCLQRMKVSARL